MTDEPGWRDLRVEVKAERDDDLPAFGAYLSPSVKRGEAIIRLNIGAMLGLHAVEGISFKGGLYT
jgi:hypothetical protein